MYRNFMIAVFVTLVSVSLSPAQEVTPTFKLRWFGQSFFQVETPRGKSIVFDPHAIPEFGRPGVKADIILCSHLHSDHTQIESVDEPKAARVFYGLEAVKQGKPADWNAVNEKVGQIQIRTVPLHHDTENGLTRGKNSAWIVEADGITFCHLGDLGHELSAAQVKAIGPVDVLMIPVGGIYTINGEQAKEVMKQLKPRLYVLPMHYSVGVQEFLQNADEFIDGQKNLKLMRETNELSFAVDEKSEAPAVVVLGFKKKVE
jgi:L-ascorbate metabolism protein UlaG (beta-lactamase superfamily)